MKFAARIGLLLIGIAFTTGCKLGSDEALRFNGSGQYVSLAHIPFDQFEAFTIEAWVKQWRGPLMCEGEASDPENSVWMSVGERAKTGTPHESCGWETGNGKNFEAALGIIRDANWHHVAMVYDGTRQMLYLDGKRVHEQNAPAPGPLESTRPFLIGVHHYEKSKKWVYGNGLVRSFKVSQRGLYGTDFKPREKLESDASTVVLLHAARRRSDKLEDLSGKHNDATLHDVQVIKTF